MIVHLDKPAAAKMIQVMDYVRRNAIVVRVSMEASLIVILKIRQGFFVKEKKLKDCGGCPEGQMCCCDQTDIDGTCGTVCHCCFDEAGNTHNCPGGCSTGNQWPCA